MMNRTMYFLQLDFKKNNFRKVPLKEFQSNAIFQKLKCLFASRIKKWIILLPLFALVTFAGCDQNQLTSFKEDYAAVKFAVDSLTYSFLGNSKGEYIQEVTVDIMGDSTGYDRFFNVEIVDDEATTAKKNEYEIINGVVGA